MNEHPERKILQSWKKNAKPWIKAINEKQIESRRLATDQAIIDVIKSLSIKNILDIGCGEGWLVRELTAQGIFATGVDAIEGLISEANARGGGVYRQLYYENFSSETIPEKYDAAVCNFSLIGKESVDNIFQQLPKVLNAGGLFVVQTLHPIECCGDLPYEDAWREGSWHGFDNCFCDPAPWYFRTIESWEYLFSSNGFSFDIVQEPIHPVSGNKLSVIMKGLKQSNK